MKLTMILFLPILSVCACSSDAPTNESGKVERPTKTPVRAGPKIEFRRAQRVPANGLRGMPWTQPGGEAGMIYIEAKAEIETADIKGARVGRGPWGQSRLELIMAPSGVAKLRALTRATIGKPLAVVVNGRVLAVVEIQGELGDSIVVEGAFKEKDARSLARELKLRNRASRQRAASDPGNR